METPIAEINSRFKPKKSAGLLLAKSYKRLGSGFEGKAFRTKNCGSHLDFVKNKNSEFKLHNADFCRDRLCPMCAWRKSLKISGQVSAIVDSISDKFDFIFLTLTVPNCLGSDLPLVLSRMQKAWSKLRKRVFFQKSIKGFFKALEITHNLKKRSKSYDTYHPHYHCILAVDKNYFTSDDYIKRDEWLSAWRSCYGDNSITQVDVRKCNAKKSNKGRGKSLSSAVAEVAKYSVKATSYLGEFDDDGNLIKPYADDIIDSSVSTLDNALKNRRLFEMRGIFKDVHDELQLDDAENGDLIITDNTDSVSDDIELYCYRWSFKESCYKLFRIIKKIDIDVMISPELDSGIVIDPETGEVI